MTTGPTAGGPLLGIGQVRHARLRPVPNRFAYATWFLLLPLRRLAAQPSPALQRNRSGLMSFHDSDHGDGRGDCLAWLDEVLAAHGVSDADGEVWLHCYPRVLGHTFKPVSFWYCHRADGRLRAVLVEVNNTFGERHCYLLDGTDVAYGRELRAAKVFHVSPFCRVEGDYRFRFMFAPPHPPAPDPRTEPARTVARIDHHDVDGLLISTSVSGELRALTHGRIAAACARAPLLTLGVVARIHWQALKLWCRRVPFLHKPVAPENFVTR